MMEILALGVCLFLLCSIPMTTIAADERRGLTNENTGVFDALHVEYHEMAPWYDDFWKDYLDKTLQKPLALVKDFVMEATGSSVVADVGCGTGVFLKRYMEGAHSHEDALPTLIGIEPSGAMLEQARIKFGDDENLVDLRQAPAESLPLDDESVNVVCSTNAFHFFRDKETALQEMYRVLRPGGSLVITDWCNDFLPVKLYHNVVERLRWMRFDHKYPGPLNSRKMLEILRQAGFENVSIETYPVRFWLVFPWGMHTITATKVQQTSCAV